MNEKVVNFDMFVNCKNPTTASKRFIKELDKKYTKEQIDGFDDFILNSAEYYTTNNLTKYVFKDEEGLFYLEINGEISEDSYYINFIIWKQYYSYSA